MRWLNYHHLLYFWTVAKAGSIAAASRQLFLSPPAISTQLKTFENAIGSRLFKREGNRLHLTDTGSIVFDYASRIFQLGSELRSVLHSRDEQRRLRVGVGQMWPKLFAGSLLQRVWSAGSQIALECREASSQDLVSALRERQLDVVILDEAPGEPNEFEHHVLMKEELGIFAPSQLRALASGFPKSLSKTKLISPPGSSELGRGLMSWLHERGANVSLAAECDDSAMVVTLAQSAGAVFAAPLIAEEEFAKKHDCVLLGRLEGLSVAVSAYFHASAREHSGVKALIGE